MDPPNKLDVDQCEVMAQLVDKLTTTGKPVLDQQQMKSFKKICKLSDEYVKHAYHLLITQLEKEHSEIRLSCFLMIDELFQRSHCFREELLGDFQYFLMLVAETEIDTPLPPPKPAAKTLKSKSLETIQVWHEKFSGTYKKLALGYNYLQHCKKVDFNDIRARNIAERRREEEQKKKQEQQQKERINNVVKELTDGKLEVETVITQLENCLQLLLPDLDTFTLRGLASPEYRPNHNPFRIRSRRISSAQGAPNKSPVYGPTATGTIAENVKDPPRRLSKGGRRKSSASTSGKHLGSEVQGFPKTRGSNPTKTRTSSPEKDSKHSLSDLPDVIFTKNFVGKEEHTENHNKQKDIEIPKDAKHKYSSRQNSSADYVKKEPGEIELHSKGKCRKREYRFSSRFSSGEEPGASDRRDQNTEDTDAVMGSGEKIPNIKRERLESVDDSDVEDNIEEMSDDEDDYIPHSQFVRESGLGSQHYSISIDLNPDNELQITETPDNADILYNMKDLNRELVNKWLPAVVKWLEVLTKNGADKTLIIKAIDLKRHITKVKEKISKVKIVKSTKHAMNAPSISIESKEDSDSDFEDVPDKEGFEPRIPDHLREEYGLVNKVPKPSTSKDWKLDDTTAEYNDASDPASWQATVKQIEQAIQKSRDSPAAKDLNRDTTATSSPRPKKKPKDPNVPTVPFGTDLLHWGEEKMEIPLVVRYESDLKGWVPKGDEADVVDVNALESMRSRVINFEGEFVPVKWKCRTPLSGGKLCERMDRKKCPFHGKIIARDVHGNPTDPADITRLKEQELKQNMGQDANVDWEDTELQADIQAQTGVQLLRQKKGKGKGRPKKYPGLTDLKKTTDRCRRRLQRKVLSQKALQRVASSLDRIQDKKIQDKFGNNFVYAIPSRLIN